LNNYGKVEIAGNHDSKKINNENTKELKKRYKYSGDKLNGIMNHLCNDTEMIGRKIFNNSKIEIKKQILNDKNKNQTVINNDKKIHENIDLLDNTRSILFNRKLNLNKNIIKKYEVQKEIFSPPRKDTFDE